MTTETNTIEVTEVPAEDAAPVAPAIDMTPARELKKDEYIATIGRRKTATAQVRVADAAKTSITVNGKDYKEYFKHEEMYDIVMGPISKIEFPKELAVSVVVRGGGLHAQAEAVRHGISRALETYIPGVRGELKRLGFLKRDPRKKERKKPGLKKARKSAQWSKR